MGVVLVSSFCLLCLAVSTVAIPKEGQWSAQGWTITGKPSPGHEVKLTFAIKQHNPDWLKDKLKAVSYPDSPHYTDYMNFDEIAQYVYGEPESVKVVTEALESMGANKIDFTIGRDFVVAWVPFEAAEKFFQANFLEFKHNEISGLNIVSSLYYTVPLSLKKHIDFVSGFIIFPGYPSKPVEKKPVGGDKLIIVTPKIIAEKYNTSDYVSTNKNNSQAVAAFLEQYFDPTDLKKFQELYKLPVKAIAKVVGKNVDDDPGAEANLDVQYISATGRNVDTWFISISTYNGKQEDFLSWITAQVNTTDSPWVHSASYGDEENSIDVDYANRVDNEFMKFGISGRTVLFASGDSGADCGAGGKYIPEWPTSSPYITAVGGTTSLTSVWSEGGGGFSNVFPMPEYQKAVVEAYLNGKDVPSKGLFNTSGRAYPDVSAFSTDFIIIDDGIPAPVSGTSCAAPTFAGIVASLNDVLLNKGMKTLGFLNPLLYMQLQGKGFFDVTDGSNGGFGCKGFNAVSGWDPASGWGNPNFGLLKDLV